MLPRANKLTSSAEFRTVMKAGGRAGTSTLVVHAVTRTDTVIQGGPRFGFVVSKQVGNAVMRHRLTRQLRHICLASADELPRNLDVVVRALPKAAGTTSDELAADFANALARARKKEQARRERA